jgi:hypothetical protein
VLRARLEQPSIVSLSGETLCAARDAENLLAKDRCVICLYQILKLQLMLAGR